VSSKIQESLVTQRKTLGERQLIIKAPLAKKSTANQRYATSLSKSASGVKSRDGKMIDGKSEDRESLDII